MSESQILEATKNYLQELNYDLEALAVKSLRLIFGHTYYMWRVLKKELGNDRALALYSKVWEAIASASFKQAVSNLGIKEIKNIPTLGKIIDYGFSSVPCLYETVEASEDHLIGRVYWCANPAYGPNDCIIDRHEYYRQEVPLTVPYLLTMINEAEKMGLKEEIEISVPEGRCRDGKASFCQILLWKRGSPKVEPVFLADSEKCFIEDRIGEEEPLFYILKKQGKTLEEFAPGCFTSFFFVDMAVYDGLENSLGREKALSLYKKLWLTLPPKWVKEARLELEIGRARNLGDLAKIVTFCEKKKFVPYQIVPNVGNLITLISRKDPFVEISTQFFGKELSSNYFQAVALADQEFIKEIVKETKISEKVEITEKKRLAKGDDKNEIVIV